MPPPPQNSSDASEAGGRRRRCRRGRGRRPRPRPGRSRPTRSRAPPSLDSQLQHGHRVKSGPGPGSGCDELGPAPSPAAGSSPAGTSRPWSMITTSWHRSSTRSSWWLENSTSRPGRQLGQYRAHGVMPTGSSPDNGSSSTSSSGSCTSAAASWTRCWLPSESVSTLLLRGRRHRGAPARQFALRASYCKARGAGRGTAAARHHAWVEASLLGHVPEPAPAPRPNRARRATAPSRRPARPARRSPASSSSCQTRSDRGSRSAGPAARRISPVERRQRTETLARRRRSRAFTSPPDPQATPAIVLIPGWRLRRQRPVVPKDPTRPDQRPERLARRPDTQNLAPARACSPPIQGVGRGVEPAEANRRTRWP